MSLVNAGRTHNVLVSYLARACRLSEFDSFFDGSFSRIARPVASSWSKGSRAMTRFSARLRATIISSVRDQFVLTSTAPIGEQRKKLLSVSAKKGPLPASLSVAEKLLDSKARSCHHCHRTAEKVETAGITKTTDVQHCSTHMGLLEHLQNCANRCNKTNQFRCYLKRAPPDSDTVSRHCS